MSLTATLPPLTSLGHRLDLDDSSFGLLEPSNHLLDDVDALRERLDDVGYLYIKNFLDVDAVMAARRSILEKIARDGALDPKNDMMEGIANPALLSEPGADGVRTLRATNFRPDVAMASAEVNRVVYGPELQGFYDTLFGEPALHFDFTWLRVMGPGYGTSVHCDLVYMSRGTHERLTCWVPYGEVPLEVGGLMVLEGSHKQAHRIQAYLDKDVDSYCENVPEQVRKVKEEGKWSFPGWLSQRPDTIPGKFGARWLTAECWQPGDFITFNMKLIHASLDNHSNRFRLSTDVRYQRASEPTDERWMGVNPPGHGLAGKQGRIC